VANNQINMVSLELSTKMFHFALTPHTRRSTLAMNIKPVSSMTGVGKLFPITGRMICALSLAGRKIN